MQTNNNPTRKITNDILTSVPVEDQAVLLGYVNKGLPYSDALDMLSSQALITIYGDHHREAMHITHRAVSAAEHNEPIDTNKEDNMSQTNIDPNFIYCCGYGLIPETRGDTKLMGKEVEASQLSKALLINLVKLLQEDRDDNEQKPEPQPKSKWSDHEHGVFQFWRDIGWSKHLNHEQRRWAVSVAKHVFMSQKDEKKWLVCWSTDFYKTDRNRLRKVMKSWASAASAAGVHAVMKPTGLLVTFK